MNLCAELQDIELHGQTSESYHGQEPSTSALQDLLCGTDSLSPLSSRQEAERTTYHIAAKQACIHFLSLCTYTMSMRGYTMAM